MFLPSYIDAYEYKEDRSHLEKFKDFIKSDRPVRYHEKKHVYELEFLSRRIVSELEKYGIHPNMRYHEKVIKRT